MALELLLSSRTPNSIKLLIGGLQNTYQFDDRYAVWQYKRQTSSKWSDVVDENDNIIETRIPAYAYSTEEPVTINYLWPDTLYEFRAFIYRDDGTLYTPDGITAEFWTAAIPEITNFYVTQPDTGRRIFSWGFSCSNIIYNETKYRVQARQSGTATWYTKVEGLITSESTDIEDIIVDKFGEYEFKFILDQCGYIVESDIVTATSEQYDFNYDCTIELSSSTMDSISVYLSNDDGGWYNLPERTVTWYISTDETFDEASYCSHTIPDGAINESVAAVTFDGLKQGTTYYIKCHIASDDSIDGVAGYDTSVYYTGATLSLISSFVVVEPDVDSKIFKWKCTLRETYDEPIEYKMMAAYSLFPTWDDFYQISSGAIPVGGMADYEDLTVDKFGSWTFYLVLTIDGEEIISSMRERSASASPITTSNFNVDTVKGSLSIVLNWSADVIHEGGTTYTLSLRRRGEDGKWSVVFQHKDVCVLNNSISIQTTGYGEHSVVILYQVDGRNYGDNYTSDTFVLVETADKPPLWEWTSPMTGQLTVNANKEVYPVTAVEWNDFTARINQMRTYLGLDNYPFTVVYGVSNGYADNPTSFTHAIYSEAVEAIQGMGSGAGGELDYVDTTHLNATMFIELRDELNAAITNFS